MIGEERNDFTRTGPGQGHFGSEDTAFDVLPLYIDREHC